MQAQAGTFQLPTHPLVAALDANRDGELSAEELDKADAALKTLDKNNDGELNDEELGGAFQFPGAGGRGGQAGAAAVEVQGVAAADPAHAKHKRF